VSFSQGLPAEAVVNLAEDVFALYGALPKLAKDSTNPHFSSRYVSLTGMADVVAPLLSKHNFVWITRPTISSTEPRRPVLAYSLEHKSGSSVAFGEFPLPDLADPQKLGSAITYARRYALAAVLGLVAEEDDDANAASPPRGKPQAAPKSAPAKRAEAFIRESFPDDGGQAPQPAPAAKPKGEKVPCQQCAAKGIKSAKGYPAVFWPAKTTCDGAQGTRPDGKPNYVNHARPAVVMAPGFEPEDEIPF
jgi:hypothetical protein